ncbi:MAG: hypothetical protein ABJA37_15350 [Ferruginibacter sp.]
MDNSKPLNYYMRILHRYIGFFLPGIMAVYALSGTVLIFRDTNFLKNEKHTAAMLAPGITAVEVGKAIKIRELKFTRTEGDIQYFEQGTYNSKTGEANYTVRELPRILNKLTQLHKASTKQPLFFLNVFFAASLLFFVISSFWMFKPETKIFKKGMIFTIAGVILTLILLMSELFYQPHAFATYQFK